MTVSQFFSHQSFRHRDYSVLTLTITFAFAIYIIGAHLRLSIVSNGSTIVPMYLMLLGSALISVSFLLRLIHSAANLILLLVVVVIVQPLLASGETSFTRSILSVGQLLSAIGSSLLFLCALSSLNKSSLRRILLSIWLVFIFLALLEVSYFKPTFDQFRSILYAGSNRFVYFSDERDLQIYGQIRATVFSSEPSFLADSLSALALMIFFLDPDRGNWRSWLGLAALVSVNFLISPSFKSLFFLLALVVWEFWPRNCKELARLALLFVAALGLLTTALSPLIAMLLIHFDAHLISGSFFGRLGVAHSVAFDVLKVYPFFGVGIGDRSDAYDFVVRAWQDSGAFGRFPHYANLPAEDLMSNGFWWLWIYLGGLGGIVFFCLIARLLGVVGVLTPWRSLVCSCIVWYAGSAFIDPQSWYIVIVFSIGALRANLHPEAETGRAQDTFRSRE